MNSSVFYFEPKANQWSHFEYTNGKFIRILEQEVPENQKEVKLFSNFEEYQTLYFEELFDYFGHLNSSERILDFPNEM